MDGPELPNDKGGSKHDGADEDEGEDDQEDIVASRKVK